VGQTTRNISLQLRLLKRHLNHDNGCQGHAPNGTKRHPDSGQRKYDHPVNCGNVLQHICSLGVVQYGCAQTNHFPAINCKPRGFALVCPEQLRDAYRLSLSPVQMYDTLDDQQQSQQDCAGVVACASNDSEDKSKRVYFVDFLVLLHKLISAGTNQLELVIHTTLYTE
jgi:hypothetical protein